jgi:hypothetical protein
LRGKKNQINSNKSKEAELRYSGKRENRERRSNLIRTKNKGVSFAKLNILGNWRLVQAVSYRVVPLITSAREPYKIEQNINL